MLFDMFSQESKTSRSRYEGTGLGLAITKQLVDRMDGSIELKSKVGVGTTVIVKIPFKIGTQDKNSNLSDKPVSLDDYSVEGMRALVVEDNELNMEISRCILEDSGMEVTCAVDGQEAVEIFEKSAPDYFGGNLYGYYDAEDEWTGCGKDNQGNEKKGCQEGSDHCNVRKCLCRRHYQQRKKGKQLRFYKG